MVRLKQWILGFISHPFKIIKGNWFRFKDKNHLLYITRYSKCKNCQELENSPIGELCGYCGCPLKSKLRVVDEKCELNKWR